MATRNIITVDELSDQHTTDIFNELKRHYDDTYTSIFSKEPETTNTQVDLLVLSCTAYRLRTQYCSNENVIEGDIAYKYKTASLLDRLIYNNIEEEDYAFATMIRNHFEKKLMVLSLKNIPLTKFREDLRSFFTKEWNVGGRYTYPMSFIGLVYRLPQLYNYDLDMYDVFEGDYRTLNGLKNTNGEKTLKHLKTVVHNRRRVNVVEFWFEDDKNDRVLITVENHNPLLNLFTKLVEENEVKIDGSYTMRIRDELQFYQTSAWNPVL